MTRFLAAALLSTTMLGAAGPAFAQDEAPVTREELRTMQSEIETLRRRVAELEAAARGEAAAPPSPPAQAAAAPVQAAAAPPAPTPAQPTVTWRGAPQFSDPASGFSFRPKGFAQFDTGSVSNPGGAVPTRNLGYNTRARRLVLGAEGTLPGGFGYNVEFNFASGTVDYEDVVLTFTPEGSPLTFTAGNFFPLSGLDTMTSSRLTSFLEREQAVDAFGFVRRLGFGATLGDPEHDRYTLSAGIFNGPIGNAFNNDMWQASVRATFAPDVGEGRRLHLGLSLQHRNGQSDAQNVRYRARPFTQLTDVRFVDTGAIAAEGDDVLGLELAGTSGPLHFAAEAHRVWVDGHRPGTVFAGLDGAGGGQFYAADPAFTSAYFELGWFVTGETRGYRRGRWDRTSVRRPVGRGGLGALQLNGRIDYLDLGDRLAGGPTGAPSSIEGGRQTGYQLSAIWTPIDQVRLLLQYVHADIAGGPLAGVVDPLPTRPIAERDYRIDSLALRAQVEF